MRMGHFAGNAMKRRQPSALGTGYDYRRYRIDILDNFGDTYMGLGEVYGYETQGGPDVFVKGGNTGGVFTASSTYNGSYSADKAFDHSGSKSINGWVNNGGTSGWLRYQSPAPISVRHLGLIPMYNETARMPSSFNLRYSDNGTTWSNALVRSSEPVWAADELRHWEVPDVGAHTYWEIQINSNQGDAYLSIGNCYMFRNDGELVRTGVYNAGIVTTNELGGQYALMPGVLDRSSGYFVAATKPSSFDIISPVKLAEIGFKCAEPLRMPKTFTIKGWNATTQSWDLLKVVGPEPSWTVNETRRYLCSGGLASQWRLYFNSLQTAGSWTALKEVEMYNSVGGADLCVGGTATALYGNASAPNAFDDTLSTAYQSFGTTMPGWLAYQFPSGVTINAVGLTNLVATDSPIGMDVQYFDGTTWVTHFSFSSTEYSSWSPAPSKRIFAKAPAGAGSQKWRINTTATQNAGAWTSISEIEWRETSGGPDASGPHDAAPYGFSITDRAGSPTHSINDGSNATYWNTLGAVVPNYIGYHFPTRKQIAEVSITNMSSAGDSPKNFTIDYWNGTAWVTQRAYNNLLWVASETKVLSALPSTFVPAQPHRYWRVRADDTYIGGDFMACTELEMMSSTTTGSDLTTGKTPVYSAQYGGYEATKAIDNTAGTFWTTGGAAPTGIGHWIGIDFGAGTPVTVNRITYQSRTDGYREDPVVLYIESSDDNIMWELEWASNARTWAAGEKRTYVRPVSANAHTYWRLFVENNQGDATFITVPELEMRAVAGSANLCAGGTAISSDTNTTGNEPDKAFDGNTTTSWAADAGVTNQWIGYQFPQPVSIEEIAITLDSNLGRNPKNARLEYSDNGTTWTQAFRCDLYAPLAGAVRVFPEAAPPSPSFHRAWRIYCLNNNGAASLITLEEVEFRGSTGGADQTVANGTGNNLGRPIASSEGVGNEAYRVFDNTSGAAWAGLNTTNEWIGYVFPNPVQCAEILLKCSTQIDRAPNDIKIEYSDDLVTWASQKDISDLTWTSQETKILSATGGRPPVG